MKRTLNIGLVLVATVLWAVPAVACEGACITDTTNAFIGNYSDIIDSVFSNVATQIHTRLAPSASRAKVHALMAPIKRTWYSGSYARTERAIFPEYFHGKCQRTINGVYRLPDGCPNPDCPVVCGTPGSMVHFYPKLVSIVFNTMESSLAASFSTSGSAYRKLEQGVIQLANSNRAKRSPDFPLPQVGEILPIPLGGRQAPPIGILKSLEPSNLPTADSITRTTVLGGKGSILNGPARGINPSGLVGKIPVLNSLPGGNLLQGLSKRGALDGLTNGGALGGLQNSQTAPGGDLAGIPTNALLGGGLLNGLTGDGLLNGAPGDGILGSLGKGGVLGKSGNLLSTLGSSPAGVDTKSLPHLLGGGSPADTVRFHRVRRSHGQANHAHHSRSIRSNEAVATHAPLRRSHGLDSLAAAPVERDFGVDIATVLKEILVDSRRMLAEKCGSRMENCKWEKAMKAYILTFP